MQFRELARSTQNVTTLETQVYWVVLKKKISRVLGNVAKTHEVQRNQHLEKTNGIAGKQPGMRQKNPAVKPSPTVKFISLRLTTSQGWETVVLRLQIQSGDAQKWLKYFLEQVSLVSRWELYLSLCVLLKWKWKVWFFDLSIWTKGRKCVSFLTMMKTGSAFTWFRVFPISKWVSGKQTSVWGDHNTFTLLFFRLFWVKNYRKL